jgi:small subunit ribosomal protein S16
MGMRHAPYYRLVVAPDRAPRDGRFIETLGTYNPRMDPPEVKLDAAKALEWLKKGAQPTGAAERLLKNAGVLEQYAAWRGSAKDAAPAA